MYKTYDIHQKRKTYDKKKRLAIIVTKKKKKNYFLFLNFHFNNIFMELIICKVT